MDSLLAKVMEHDAQIKGAERRINNLETEVHDLRALTEAVAVTNTNVEQLSNKVVELHQDVKELKEVPANRWEKLVTTVITGIVGALIGAICTLIFN